ncbi:MAG: YceH family protein [Herminiimonas sp.]|uniref:YceH family protein n=1 Tax=Herminiimonas sp. TaxID=1926289 RepID=UPI002724D625|nr:YceH family protein [Herminiimonas sp.]MDO9419646.1 YceH family protein [Herminiimonas sp.]
MSNEISNSQVAEQSSNEQFLLDAAEIRVLAVLAEKEALTPDSYPMSLNALTNGCNQLTSRDPVMSMSEGDVQAILQRLMEEKFVTEVHQAGARVSKYQHRLRVKWSLEQDKLAVLTILMLRGIQTAGEIRTRSGRLHDFSAIADVEIGLQFLMDKYPPLVARLPRTPGTKEARYAALLSGEFFPETNEAAVSSASGAADVSRQDRITQLEEEVSSLRQEVAGLTEQFQQFKKQFE